MESIVRSFRVSQVLWKSGHWAICSWPYEAPCIVIQQPKKLESNIFHSSSNYGLSWLIDIQHGALLKLSKEDIYCATTTGKSLHPIILIFDETNPHHAPGLHFKSRQRKVMQEDLATILIKVWINFSTKFIVTSTLFDTVRAIFEIKEFILYTLWYSDERLNFCHRSKLM